MYSGTCVTRHTKGPGICIGLYRMSEYSSFILVNRNTFGPYIFVRCHRMSENSGVGEHKFHCIIQIHMVSCVSAISFRSFMVREKLIRSKSTLHELTDLVSSDGFLRYHFFIDHERTKAY